MPQLFYEDGSAIPDAAIPDAVARGQAFAKPGAPIAVRDKVTGQIGRIEATDLGNPNYVPLSDAELEAERIHAERGTLGQQAITGAEGLARGATLGLSDVALSGALGSEYRKGALERREENAKTAGVTEFGGALLPLLATEGGSAVATGAAEGSALARGAGAVARTVGAPIRALGSVGGAVERGVAGSLAPALGESLLGRAATKAVSLGVSGAVEGAVFGAGQTLSDSTLKGDPLTTEALMAGMGHGALFGGALGAGLGAASELAPAALGKVLPSKEGLEKSAVGFARKQLGRDFEKVGKDMPREVAEGWKDASAKDLLEYKLQTGPNAGKTVLDASTKPQDIADNIGLMRREKGAALGAVREKAATIMDADPALAPNAWDVIERVETRIKELRKTKVAGNYSLARTMEREIAPLKRSLAEERLRVGVSPGAEASEVAGTGFDEAAAMAGRVAKDSGEAEAVDSFLNKNRRSVSEAERSGAANETSSGVNKFLRKAQSEGATYDGLVYRGTNPEELEQIAKTGRVTHTLSVSQDVEGAGHFAKKGGVLLEIKDHPVPVDGIEGSNTFSEALIPKDTAARIVGERVENGTRIVSIEMQAPGSRVPGSVVANDVSPSMGYRELLAWHQALEQSLNPLGVAKSMRGVAIKNFGAKQEVADIANRFLKDNTAAALTAAGEDGSIVTRLHQEYAGALAMQKAAEKEAGRVASNRKVSLTDHMLGIGSALLAMSSGNMGALATMGMGGAAAIGNKIAREQGNAIMAKIALRASRMNSLVDGAAHALSGTGEKLIAPVKVIIEAEKPAPYQPRSQAELKEQFAQVRDRLQELQSPQQQQAQLAHATGQLQSAYPEAANALNLHLLQAQSYLNDQLPQPRGGSPLSPLARQPTVPPREMQKFLSKANAVMAPEAVIADIAKGKLDDDAIGALQRVYPQTFAALRNATMKYTAANKEEMPYQRVVHISRLFGFAGDSSMGPRFTEIQAAIQAAEAPLQNSTKQGGPAMPRLKGPTMKPGEDMTLPSAHAPGSR